MSKISGIDTIVMAIAIMFALASLEIIVFALGGRSYKQNAANHRSGEVHHETPAGHPGGVSPPASSRANREMDSQHPGADSQLPTRQLQPAPAPQRWAN